MRVFTITQGGAFLFGDAQRLAVVVFHKPVHDGAVVVRADTEGVGGKTAAVVDGGLTLLVFEQPDKFSVVFLRRHNQHIGEVLRAGTDERDATDVDLLDDGRGIFGLGHGLLEWIKVNDDKVERWNVILLHLFLVRLKLGPTQDATKYLGMQGLHATTQDGWIARERFDGLHRRVQRFDKIVGASSGVNLHAILFQQVDNGVDASFIKY